ncbi:MAG: energy-coupling factor transporter transmembrane protein EcfT [Clostridia bacterium]|nr:energy-coupling factor transporter transmembrane protein EcfT [Clostridia bacterium]MBR2943780.1 energy-coupling factor transporter transmembrane protein EcfT [Clostridia bacterium]
MAFDVSLGQYYEGKSLIHKLDPRTKLIYVIMFMVSIFVAKSIYAFALLSVVVLLTVIFSRVPIRTILRGLKPLIVIVAFTAILNIFWTKAESDPLWQWKFITIYKEGLINAGLLALRIILLLVETTLFLSYTTTPIELTDGIESLLAPLKLIKLPVHEFAMLMTIALRFIPTLTDETSKIMNAQKARGADFSSGGLIKRAKALIPIIIPLFVSSFRRADELATAMECRCYRGGEGRTRMKKLKFKVKDVFGWLFSIALLAGVILMNIFLAEYGYMI